MSFDRAKGNVVVYACGGTGVNIGSSLENLRDRDELGFGKISIVYLDTSSSNFDKKVNGENNTYKVGEGDGSGSVRSENYPEISSRIREILQKFKPADLSIILHSGSGGSGSVISVLLAAELMQKGHPVVSIMVGDTNTKVHAQNTLKTILSYQNIATKNNTPIAVGYVENNANNARTEVDAYIREFIISLTVLFSRENTELDNKDLENWLNFSKVTSFGPQLASLQIGPDVASISARHKDLGSIGNVISVASLVRSHDYPRLKSVPDYQCVGVVPPDANINITTNAPMHFVIGDGFFHDVSDRLEKYIKQLDDEREALVARKTILTTSKSNTDEGLVL